MEREKIEEYIKRTRGLARINEDNNQQVYQYKYNVNHSFNWGEDIDSYSDARIVVVRFKNGRKDFYQNSEQLFLKISDVVVVEAANGHDVGIVDLTGFTAYWEALKNKKNKDENFLKIYRKAKSVDIEKWFEAVSREETTFKRTKEIIKELSLEMKLIDVEFQGDGTKATFYYTANDRVDFRELIKVLAQEFKIRVEMRQIGARQEAAKVGGIGSCGMELCCIRWKKNFESVTTNAARFQELSLNPSKLAGQCGKLKCCLNYEIDSYIEARKSFPDTSIHLKTKQGTAYYQKSDVFKKVLWYSFDPENSVNITPLTIDRVNEIIEMNSNNIEPDTLLQNKLETADLINSKHKVQIDEKNIVKSKEPKGQKKSKIKKNSIIDSGKQKKNSNNKRRRKKNKNNDKNNNTVK